MTYNKLYKDKKLKAWIDLSTYCNAACPQCHRTDPRTSNKVDWLPLIQWSLEEFKTAFPKKTMKYIKSFQLCGSLGDPCMNKDIFKICEYIVNNSNCFLEINTNGSMRDEFWWTHLGYTIKDRGRVYFCVDGIDQKMHGLYRQKTDLDKVLKHMKAYSKYGVSAGFTIVFKHNEDYLKDIYQIVSDKIGDHYHLFVPTDRAYHIDKFKFYNEYGELKILEHSPKYGRGIRRDYFEIGHIT